MAIIAIPVSNPRQFPHQFIGCTAATLEIAQRWAERKGAVQFWYYKHATTGTITAAIEPQKEEDPNLKDVPTGGKA